MNRIVPVALVLARPSGGLPHAHPVGRLVTGAPEPVLLHEGLQHVKGMAVALLPVGGDSLSDLPENMAGQMSRLEPTARSENAVIGDERQAVRALLSRPTNPPIAGSTLPGRRSKEQAGQIDARATSNQVADVLADGPAIAEVVMSGQIALEAHDSPAAWGQRPGSAEGAARTNCLQPVPEAASPRAPESPPTRASGRGSPPFR